MMAIIKAMPTGMDTRLSNAMRQSSVNRYTRTHTGASRLEVISGSRWASVVSILST